MLLIVNALSSVESARLSLGPPPQPAICFYYVALFSSFLALHIKRCKLATFVVFMVALSLLIVRPKAEDVIVTTIQNSVAIVSQDGSAVTIPELKPNKTFQKFAAFHGAKPTQNFNLHSCRGQFVMQLGNFTFLIYRENIDKSCSSSNLQCEPLPFITGATTFMIVPGISHATSAECSKRLEKLRKILEQFRPYYVLLFSEGAYHRMPALFFSGYEPGSAPVGVSVVAPSGMRAIILRRI
jgi:hypothetical protein